jgi:PIN domain
LFRLLIDTCVWLDLAKDHSQLPLLGVLEELTRQNTIQVLLPRTVVVEFSRNKTRIAEESGPSLSGVLKRVKAAVDKFGDPKRKRIVLEDYFGHGNTTHLMLF